MEEWRDVVGYEGLYMVSNIGNVKSYKRSKSKILMNRLALGYHSVVLADINKCYKGFRVHRLVGFAFMMDTYFEGAVINHKDGIKTNNTVGNLEWVTQTENNIHSVKSGFRKPKKEINAKVNPDIVREIRTRQLSYSQYAKKFGIGVSTVQKIVQRVNWNHIN